jgi:hypothetical protein
MVTIARSGFITDLQRLGSDYTHLGAIISRASDIAKMGSSVKG